VVVAVAIVAIVAGDGGDGGDGGGGVVYLLWARRMENAGAANTARAMGDGGRARGQKGIVAGGQQVQEQTQE